MKKKIEHLSSMNGKPAIQPVKAKKLLKANKNTGNFAKGVPDLIAYTTELFIEEMIQKILGTKENGNNVQIPDIVQIIQSTPEYDFLLPLIPDIQAMAVEEQNKKTKKDKTKDE